MTQDFLSSLVQVHRLTHVVDVGANPIDGDPPYFQMLTEGLCRVTGFEPQEDALGSLRARGSALESYFPYIVGDGQPATLNICRYSGWTSLLKPSGSALSVFSQFQANATVERSIPVQTHRLDDLKEIGEFDFLKIDVQGGERAVFDGARQSLSTAVAIQTEVSFVPLYEQQCGFGEIDVLLRSLGFVPHTFAAVKLCPVHAITGTNSSRQLLEADLVYVRDFVNGPALAPEQLKHLALIAHHCYKSFDLAALCIQRLVSSGSLGENTLTRYQQFAE